jgi:hypothetical protein
LLTSFTFLRLFLTFGGFSTSLAIHLLTDLALGSLDFLLALCFGRQGS